MRKPSQKQVERQLETWKKNDKAMYLEIMTLAEQQGILLKSGKLSKNKKKKEEVNKFIAQYSELYGSFTKYQKKMKETVKKYREHLKDEGKEIPNVSYKEQYKKIKEYSDLVGQLFDEYRPSEEAYEIYMEAETMDIDTAIDYLKKVLRDYREDKEEETEEETI